MKANLKHANIFSVKKISWYWPKERDTCEPSFLREFEQMKQFDKALRQQANS